MRHRIRFISFKPCMYVQDFPTWMKWQRWVIHRLFTEERRDWLYAYSQEGHQWNSSFIAWRIAFLSMLLLFHFMTRNYRLAFLSFHQERHLWRFKPGDHGSRFLVPLRFSTSQSATIRGIWISFPLISIYRECYSFHQSNHTLNSHSFCSTHTRKKASSSLRQDPVVETDWSVTNLQDQEFEERSLLRLKISLPLKVTTLSRCGGQNPILSTRAVVTTFFCPILLLLSSRFSWDRDQLPKSELERIVNSTADWLHMRKWDDSSGFVGVHLW